MYIAVYLLSILQLTTTQPQVLNIKNPSNHRVSKLFLLYKIFNKILYFPSGIFTLKPFFTHSSSHNELNMLSIHFSHTSASLHCFVPSASDLWNALLYSIKSCL